MNNGASAVEAPKCCICASNLSSGSDFSRQLCENCNQRIPRLISDSGIANQSIKIEGALAEGPTRLEEHQFNIPWEIAGGFGDPADADILVKPGRGNGPAIPAHSAVLAEKSVFFKYMLDCDTIKAPSDSITLPEMNHAELQTLLEFLYCGQLSKSKIQMHAISLLRAADKYDISCLEQFCEHAVIRSLDPISILDYLDVADDLKKTTLRTAALDHIKSKVSVVFTAGFESLAVKKPHLALVITRTIVAHLCLQQGIKLRRN